MAPVRQGQSALDTVNERLLNGQIALAIDDLADDLIARRLEEPDSWQAYAKACLEHPVRALLHQDPFTYRAFSKPRGYAGDAVMMDYIYGLGEAAEAASNATPLGRAIFEHNSTRPSSCAVRYRREMIASLIDRVGERPDARVLAIAAGHLREVELSSAMRTGKIQDFLAFDQDEASLALVDRDYARLGVRTMPGSVRHILQGTAKLGQFDFVYAAGLFDYLNAQAAAALTCRMFEMTRPGGMMLIPNFLTGVADSGYMEAFMDWRLIYRNHADMQALAAALPKAAVEHCQVFDDSHDAVTYLLVSKVR